MRDEIKEKKLFIFLLFIFSIIFLNSIFNVVIITLESESTKNNLIYKNKTNINYLVSINENDFIKKSLLGAGETYISSITNKINMTMEYSYSASETLPITANYKVVATVIGIYNLSPTEKDNNPVIWKKEYVIKELEEKKYTTQDSIKIKENFDLDWVKYNEDIIKFKEYFTIPTLSKLEVKMIVNLEGLNDKYELKETKEIVASMPLTEQVFSVDANLEDEEEKILASKDTKYLQDNQRKLSIYAVLSIITTFLIIVTIKKITSFKKIKTFHNKIEEIKKEYNDIVVETKNMINTKGLKPIAITTFEEMLNLADSFITPIMLYEESDLACFYMVKSEVIYIYIIKNKPTKH